MNHRFTFSAVEPSSVPKSKRKLPIQELYRTLRGTNMLTKTLFTHEFVYKNYINQVSRRSKVITSAMVRDGFKCAGCGESHIRYRLIKNNNNFAFEPVVRKIINGKVHVIRMTMDHNLLDSLGGRYDVKNTKALCTECNGLRGNIFAEFEEFKYWYDSTEDHSVEPPTNFCYIEFKKNIQDSKIARNMTDISVVPPIVKEQLTERFSDGIIDLEMVIDYGSTNFRNDTMNDLLNGLIQIYMRNHLGLQYARKPYYVFTDHPREVLSKYRKHQIQLVEQRIRDEIAINTSVKQYFKNIFRTFILRK